MNSTVLVGHKLTVGFLAVLFIVACVNIMWGLAKGTKLGFLIAFSSAISCVFAGTTAWYIFHWRPAGRILGFMVVLEHMSFLVNWQGPLGLYSKALTVPVLLMGIWLLLPEVKQKFGPLKKA